MNQLHPRVAASIAGTGDVIIHDHDSIGRHIHSPQDFAVAIGVPLKQITKSLFLRSKTGSGYAVAVLGMDRKLDFKAASLVAGIGRLEIGKPEELVEVIGYPRNGVSPLGLPDDIVVVIDKELRDFSTVLVGGGATGIEIQIAPAAIVELTGAKIDTISAAA